MLRKKPHSRSGLIETCIACKPLKDSSRLATFYTPRYRKKIVAVYPMTSQADLRIERPASSTGFRLWRDIFKHLLKVAPKAKMHCIPMVRCVADSVKKGYVANCWELHGATFVKQADPDLIVLFGKECVKFLCCYGGKTPTIQMLAGSHWSEVFVGRKREIFVFEHPDGLVLQNEEFLNDYQERLAREEVEKSRDRMVDQITRFKSLLQEMEII